MKNNISNLYGLGKTPFSATTASAIAALMYWGLFHYYPQIKVFLFTAVFIISLMELYTNKAVASTDPKEIVVDEWLGMFVALLLARTGNWMHIGVLFVLFRVLDIFKPFPFNVVDKRLKSWWGLIMDDVVIGIVIGLGFQLFVYFY